MGAGLSQDVADLRREVRRVFVRNLVWSASLALLWAAAIVSTEGNLTIQIGCAAMFAEYLVRAGRWIETLARHGR